MPSSQQHSAGEEKWKGRRELPEVGRGDGS